VPSDACRLNRRVATPRLTSTSAPVRSEQGAASGEPTGTALSLPGGPIRVASPVEWLTLSMGLLCQECRNGFLTYCAPHRNPKDRSRSLLAVRRGRGWCQSRYGGWSACRDKSRFARWYRGRFAGGEKGGGCGGRGGAGGDRGGGRAGGEACCGREHQAECLERVMVDIM
jgi:hypothetical protein